MVVKPYSIATTQTFVPYTYISKVSYSNYYRKRVLYKISYLRRPFTKEEKEAYKEKYTINPPFKYNTKRRCLPYIQDNTNTQVKYNYKLYIYIYKILYLSYYS